MKSYRLRERAHDELLYDILDARGITGEKEMAEFLEPDFLRDSHDPFLLPDMGVAVERIEKALRNNEKVCVWSDYDCDGIPGGVMLTDFLRSIGLSVRHYIPHRHEEGYGLNNEGLAELASEGITLVITIDLGTTEIEGINFAKTKGIDVIVTDHHVVQELDKNFPALALINPKRPDSNYPFDGLCGAGVAWKLVQGVLAKNRFKIAEGQEKWFLDLVGIATLSDMVPLVNENRMLAHFGLRVMRRNRRPGLASLLTLLRIQPFSLTEDDIGFMVAPRINAASRMDKPDMAANLLRTNSREEANEFARELNRVNDERKGLVAATVKEVNRRLKEMPEEGPVIVMGNPKWRPGILGLVANSLVASHQKPVFLWGREGGETIKGSCRSDGVVSVVSLMQSAGDIFEGFGGHHASGGFSLLQERVHELPARLANAYTALRAQSSPEKEIVIDREIEMEEIPHAMRDLSRLAPFGEGNAKPLFILPQVTVGRSRMFGKGGDHLDVLLTRGSTSVSGISFFANPESFQKRVSEGVRADVVGHIESDWRGRPRVRIVDVI